MSTSKPKHPILQVTDLTARYGKVTAVTGANIAVTRGSIVTVIGGNGAGKSTLLNAIMGALPSTGNSSGSVQYLDRKSVVEGESVVLGSGGQIERKELG